MLRVLETEEELSAAEHRLANVVRAASKQSGTLNLGYPGGQRQVRVFWIPGPGLWITLHRVEQRYWHACGLGDPFAQTEPIGIDVEINPPTQGIDRRLAGVFARDDSGGLHLLHRGGVGGGTRGVGKSTFLQFLTAQNIPLTPVKDGDQESHLIHISRLAADRLFHNIAAFVGARVRFRRTVAGGQFTPKKTETRGFTPEREGRSQRKAQESTEIEWTHGSLVNELERRLRANDLEPDSDTWRDVFVRNQQGNVSLLFEVKSSDDRYSSYTALGQLFFHAPPGQATDRIAVLPDSTPRSVSERLERCGIQVVQWTWEGDRPDFHGLTECVRQL